MPEAARARLRMDKVTAYLLNEPHKDGKHKCAFFKSFGFSPADPFGLASALKAHALEHDVARTVPTDFGTRYVVECPIRSPDGRDPRVVTVWQADAGGVPAFVTAYPK